MGEATTEDVSGSRTFSGVTVVVARPESQAHGLVDLLEARGADVVAVPLIQIVELDCREELVRAAVGLTAEDWIVVSSSNAAAALVAATTPGGSEARSNAKVAAVGPATAASLPRVDLVPARNSAAGLVEELPSGHGRVVVLQAAGGAPTLVDGLAAKGWQVQRIDTHVAVPNVPSAGEQLALLKADAVVFTSGSQARAWAVVLGSAAPPVVVAIGPQTAHDARAAGMNVTAVADEHTLPGVVAALERALGR
jgi:uroporphyrinogen-III synthase